MTIKFLNLLVDLPSLFLLRMTWMTPYAKRLNLNPCHEPGNLLRRNRYIDLPLPWTLTKPIPEFDESIPVRKEWDASEPFFVGEPEVDMDTFEDMMAISNSATRWRQAHPDDVGTERDMLKILRKDIERALAQRRRAERKGEGQWCSTWGVIGGKKKA